MNNVGIIPVRLGSERFPDKLLQPLLGKPILQRTIENALQFDFINKLVIATEDDLPDYVKDYDVEIFRVRSKTWCGSQKASLYYNKDDKFENYISIPADEPMLDPVEINKSFHSTQLKYPIHTFYSDFHSEERLNSRSSCKIASSKNRAIYFSRSVIPMSKSGDGVEHKKHIGIFIFNNSTIKVNLWSNYEGSLAQTESLEQNIFIENGYKVGLIKTEHKYCGVDTPEDVEYIEKLYKQRSKE